MSAAPTTVDSCIPVAPDASFDWVHHLENGGMFHTACPGLECESDGVRAISKTLPSRRQKCATCCSLAVAFGAAVFVGLFVLGPALKNAMVASDVGSSGHGVAAFMMPRAVPGQLMPSKSIPPVTSAVAVKQGQHPRSSIFASAVKTVDRVDDFDAEVSSAKSAGKTMIIEYFQPRCRACRALGLKLDQFARRNPSAQVVKVDATTDAGNAIAQRTGPLKKLPRVDVYKEGHLVYQDVMTISEWPDFVSELPLLGMEDAIAGPDMKRHW